MGHFFITPKGEWIPGSPVLPSSSSRDYVGRIGYHHPEPSLVYPLSPGIRHNRISPPRPDVPTLVFDEYGGLQGYMELTPQHHRPISTKLNRPTTRSKRTTASSPDQGNKKVGGSRGSVEFRKQDLDRERQDPLLPSTPSHAEPSTPSDKETGPTESSSPTDPTHHL